MLATHDNPRIVSGMPAPHRGARSHRRYGWRMFWLASTMMSVFPFVLVTFTPLRWNLSASMPVGVYRITPAPLARGQLVGLCLPPPVAQFGWERGYISNRALAVFGGECAEGDQPLLKTITAVPGDSIDIRPEAVTINGVPVAGSATHAHDSHGRVLPHVPWGTYTLKEGELWVMSTSHPHSWDSRYFGPVSVRDVIATVVPVWVTSTPESKG